MASGKRISNKSISGYNNYFYFLSKKGQVLSFFVWKFKNSNKMCLYFLKKQWPCHAVAWPRTLKADGLYWRGVVILTACVGIKLHKSRALRSGLWCLNVTILWFLIMIIYHYSVNSNYSNRVFLEMYQDNFLLYITYMVWYHE